MPIVCAIGRAKSPVMGQCKDPACHSTRIQTRGFRIHVARGLGEGVSSSFVISRKDSQRPIAATRSSIKSRSTSQYLSDERRRLCAGSTWLDCSSSVVASDSALEHLLDFPSLRLDLDVLERLRLSRPALINDSPFS